MAIVFLQQKKIQEGLIFVLIAVLVITIAVIWQGFSKKERVPIGEEIILLPEKKVEIDFGVFDNPLLEKFQPFSQIQPLKEALPGEEKGGEEIGRDNPFLPY